MRRFLCVTVLLFVGRLEAWEPEVFEPWPDGDIALALNLNATTTDKTADWNAAAREAMTTWNSVLQRVQLKEEPAGDRTWYDNGHNELFFDDEIYGQPFPNGVLAITYTSSDSLTKLETDVVFNRGKRWGVYHGALLAQDDLRRVALHELGHVLGLDHPDEYDQTVSAIMNSHESDLDTLTNDDLTGIHALYDTVTTAPPVIVQQPEATTIDEGSSGQVYVLAAGRGPFHYAWLHDGKPMADQDSPGVLFPAAETANGGSYVVTVTNAAGSTTSTAVNVTVSPAVLPQVGVYVAASDVPAGSDVGLGAQIGSGTTGALTFQWSHNGTAIPGATTAAYTIADVQFSDGGDYTVTATNPAGSATSAPTHLVVKPLAPPEFPLIPDPVTVAVGESEWLDAKGIGGDPITYQWSKDGVALPGATKRVYVLQAQDRSQSGQYTLTATNAAGTATSPAIRVTVLATKSPGETQPPLIKSNPSSCAEYAGARLQFHVTATGENLQYQWLKDGVALPPSSAYTGEQTAGLMVVLADAAVGTYTVRIANSAGVVTSAPAKLTMLTHAAPVIVGQPPSPNVQIGSTADFGAGVEPWFSNEFVQGQVPYHYQWFKDGVAIAGATGDEYVFTAKEGDAGKYFVRVTSPAGSTDSATGTLTITPDVPLLPYTPGDSLIDPSLPETIRLLGVGLEVWLRRIMSKNPGAQASLDLVEAVGPTIMGFTPGKYVLTVTLGDKTVKSAPFSMTFLSGTAPVITYSSGNQTVDVGESAQVTVNYVAIGSVTFQWSKDGVPIPGQVRSTYDVPSMSAADVGTYQCQIADETGSVTSEPVSLAVLSESSPTITTQPYSVLVQPGLSLTLGTVATGAGLRYQWAKDGQAISGATSANFSVASPHSSDSGSYAVTVTNEVGAVTSQTVHVVVLDATRAPAIVTQPRDTRAPVGGDVTLTVGVSGAPLPDHYQWRKDGVDIPGAHDAALRLHNVGDGDTGVYSVVAYSASGSVTSTTARLTVDPAARMVNLATRAQVGTGANVLIAGFSLSDGAPKRLLIRGVGKQLAAYGVTHNLRNPSLEVYDQAGHVVASNENWEFETNGGNQQTAVEAAEDEVGAFRLHPNGDDAALITTLAAGTYTAKVSGYVTTTGVALVEVYEIGAPTTSQMVNLSCRGFVGTGAEIVIPSTVLKGTASRRVLVRAVGPPLTKWGVTGVLADPELEVYQGNVVLARNDNWSDQADPDAVELATAKAGAFPLERGSTDAALLLDLPPGAYTFHVKGVNGTTGVALVELYAVP